MLSLPDVSPEQLRGACGLIDQRLHDLAVDAGVRLSEILEFMTFGVPLDAADALRVFGTLMQRVAFVDPDDEAGRGVRLVAADDLGARVVARQTRAGRAFLNWEARDLARRAGVPLADVMDYEARGCARSATMLQGLVDALACKGVLFLRPCDGLGRGVRLTPAGGAFLGRGQTVFGGARQPRPKA